MKGYKINHRIYFNEIEWISATLESHRRNKEDGYQIDSFFFKVGFKRHDDICYNWLFHPYKADLGKYYIKEHTENNVLVECFADEIENSNTLYRYPDLEKVAEKAAINWLVKQGNTLEAAKEFLKFGNCQRWFYTLGNNEVLDEEVITMVYGSE